MSTIQATALQPKEEMQSQADMLQRISTNWENRKVTIIVSGAFTLLAAAGLIAATVLTAGTATIAAASIALALGAFTTTGLLYSPSRQPSIDSSRVEKIVPEATVDELEREEPVEDHKEPHSDLIDSKGHVLQRDEPIALVPHPHDEPQLFPLHPDPILPHEEPQPPIEHPVAHVGEPVLFDIPDEPTLEDPPKLFDIEEEKPSAYSWKEIAGIGAVGIGAAALIYGYSQGYFSFQAPVIPEDTPENPPGDFSSTAPEPPKPHGTPFQPPVHETPLQQSFCEANDTTPATASGAPLDTEMPTPASPSASHGSPEVSLPKTPVAPVINGTTPDAAKPSGDLPAVFPAPVMTRVEKPPVNATNDTIGDAVPPTIVTRPFTLEEQPQKTSHQTTFSIKEKPFYEMRECLPEPEEAFVQKYEAAEQCPTGDAYIEHQAENGYFGWGIDKMRRLFGSERDLSLNESRHGFYHGVVQQNIPKMVKAHPKYDGAPTKEVARDISTLRDTARDYTRERSWKVLHSYLNWAEPRGNGFDFYWNKYKGNATKVIEGATRSNGKYDSPKYLASWDWWLGKMDFSAPAKTSAAPAMDLPNMGSRTTRTDHLEPVATPQPSKLQQSAAPKAAQPPKADKKDEPLPTFQPPISSYGQGTTADPNPRPDHGYTPPGYRRRNG